MFDEINNSILKITESEHGEHDSAYCLPILAKKLRKVMTWFPLWSCIYGDRFGYGKIINENENMEISSENGKQSKDKLKNHKDRTTIFIFEMISFLFLSLNTYSYIRVIPY